jgi:hypothetical protein
VVLVAAGQSTWTKTPCIQVKTSHKRRRTEPIRYSSEMYYTKDVEYIT